jgi:hypothetical protein
MKRKKPNKKLRKALTINATQNYYLSRKPEKLFVLLKEGKITEKRKNVSA